jgi:hypothetical protein
MGVGYACLLKHPSTLALLSVQALLYFVLVSSSL